MSRFDGMHINPDAHYLVVGSEEPADNGIRPGRALAVRRALCRCGHMLMLNASGYVVAQSDRGMWVTVALPIKDCPRCGADLDTSDRVTVVP